MAQTTKSAGKDALGPGRGALRHLGRERAQWVRLGESSTARHAIRDNEGQWRPLPRSSRFNLSMMSLKTASCSSAIRSPVFSIS